MAEMAFGDGQFLSGGRDLAESRSTIEFCNGRDRGIRIAPFRLSDADKFEGSCGGGFRNSFPSEMLDHSSIELYDYLLVVRCVFADHPPDPWSSTAPRVFPGRPAVSTRYDVVMLLHT